MKLLVVLVALSLVEVALARGVQALSARVAGRIVQALQVQKVQKVQQVVAVSHLLQEHDASLPELYFLSASRADKDMPDRKPQRSGSESPDDPASGRPDWDKPRRGGTGGSPSDSGSGRSAVHWDSPSRDARHWDS